MNKHFANLGTAAVMDADCLTVGQYTEIDGQVLVLEKIDGIKVYWRPVTGKEMWLYRWDQISTGTKQVAAVLVAVAVALWWILR